MSTPTRRQLLISTALVASASALPVLAADPEKPSKNPPKFRLGLVTYNLAADWPLDVLLKNLKTTGVSPVELRTTHKHGVEPTLTKEQRKEVRAKFADSGVEFWGCGSTCEFHSTSAVEVTRNVESCKKFVALSADLGGKGVKVRPNGLPDKKNPEKTLAQIGKALKECGQAAADAGVEIWVEVHGAGTAHPPYIKTIMEACDHPKVGITWNSNPSDIKNGSVQEYFKLLRPWLKSCHINELYRDSAGTYPYRELFRLMRETDYDRVTMCEVGRKAPDPETGAEILRYYKALWTELAQG
jgi:sugar phosphate isomerase/epimerase